jgi:hypothetical protein
MTGATQKLIAETKDWRAHLAGDLVEIEHGETRWVVPAAEVAELRWLLDKVHAYLSLSAWEKQ